MVTRRERGMRAAGARRGQAHGRECSGRQGRECDAVERAVHGVSSPCLFVVYRLSLGYRRCEAGAHCDPQVRKLRDVWWATALLGSPPLVCVGWRLAIGAFLMSSLRHTGRADHEQLTQLPHTLTPHVYATSLGGSGYDTGWSGWPVNSALLSAR